MEPKKDTFSVPTSSPEPYFPKPKQIKAKIRQAQDLKTKYGHKSTFNQCYLL